MARRRVSAAVLTIAMMIFSSACDSEETSQARRSQPAQSQSTEAKSAPATPSTVLASAAAQGAAAAGSAQPALDYERARWHPIHFKPAIDTATDAQCLTCHQEIVTSRVLPQSPAGVKASESLAWYQTLGTYQGDQATFHERHRATPFANKVMNLQCNFCHQGNDPREEAPDQATQGKPPFNLRKMVNAETTCLLCHGAFPYAVMTGVERPWHEVRDTFETEGGGDGCLSCHEQLFRTVRHRVSYLNAEAIETAAKEEPDVCYGCHGGRAWYRISYPYPRHPWPDMDPEVPDWAKTRPTESDRRYRLNPK